MITYKHETFENLVDTTITSLAPPIGPPIPFSGQIQGVIVSFDKTPFAAIEKCNLSVSQLNTINQIEVVFVDTIDQFTSTIRSLPHSAKILSIYGVTQLPEQQLNLCCYLLKVVSRSISVQVYDNEEDHTDMVRYILDKWM